MTPRPEPPFPPGIADEREQLLAWLAFLRGAVARKAGGLTDEQAHWTPDGRLIPLAGVVRHLTRVEWRWIDGGFTGATTSRSREEFRPGRQLTIARALAEYTERARTTDELVRRTPLTTPCAAEPGTDLRWVLLHLINETARHAGHADAVRELLDGTTGE